MLTFLVDTDPKILGVLFVGMLVSLAVAIGLVRMEAALLTLELAERDYTYEQVTFDGHVGTRPCVVDADGGLLMTDSVGTLQRLGDGVVSTIDVASGTVKEPDCGVERIAFVRQSSAGRGIWVSDWNGGGQISVTKGGHEPALSNDGQYVAYQSVPIFNPLARAQTSQIYVSKVGEPGVTTIGGEGDAVQPAWSPTGQRIVFWRLNDGTRELWTDSAQGDDPVQVRTGTRDHWSPVWTEDGIYYVSDSAGVSKIWRVFVDESTGATRSVAQEVATGTEHAVWHLDANQSGSILAFESTDQRNELMKLRSVDGELGGGRVHPHRSTTVRTTRLGARAR